MVFKVCAFLNVSERRVSQVLDQDSTTQRNSSHINNDEERLVACIIELEYDIVGMDIAE